MTRATRMQLLIATAALAALTLLLLVAPSAAEEGSKPLFTGLGDDEESGCGSTVGKSTAELAAEGKGHARSGQWSCARLFLQRAYSQQKSYDIAGNLGIVTHELALERHDSGLFVEAATHLSAALRGFPVSGPANQRAALKERLADARGRVVTIAVELSPAGGCLTISGRDAGCGPFADGLFAPAGSVTVKASAQGYRDGSHEIANASAGSRHKVRLALDVAGGAVAVVPGSIGGSEAASVATGGFPAWPAIGAGGLAAVALAVGIGLWVDADGALSQRDELVTRTEAQTGRDNFCYSPETAEVQAACDEIRSLLGRHDDRKNAAVWLLVSAGVLGVGAGVLSAVHLLGGDSDGSEEPSSSALVVAPAFDLRGGVGVIAGGRW